MNSVVWFILAKFSPHLLTVTNNVENCSSGRWSVKWARWHMLLWISVFNFITFFCMLILCSHSICVKVTLQRFDNTPYSLKTTCLFYSSILWICWSVRYPDPPAICIPSHLNDQLIALLVDASGTNKKLFLGIFINLNFKNVLLKDFNCY